jgi:hypothetical protein
VLHDVKIGSEYRRPWPDACRRSTSVHTAALTASGPVEIIKNNEIRPTCLEDDRKRNKYLLFSSYLCYYGLL